MNVDYEQWDQFDPDEDDADAWDETGPDDEGYPALRAVLSHEFRDASAHELEALVEQAYPEMSAEDLENFLGALGRAGREIGRVAQRALPGVAQGAAAGAALGPWGALAGGLAGGALGALGGSRSGGRSRSRARRPSSRRASSRRASSRPQPRPASSPSPRAGSARPAAATASPAAVQLLQMLSRPEVGQALASLVLGGAGNSSVRVGDAAVPVGAITSTLRRMLEHAEVEHHRSSANEDAAVPWFMVDDDGEYVIDPMDEDERAALVLSLFEQLDAMREADDEDEEDFDEDDDYSDEGDFEDDELEAEDDEEQQGMSFYEGVDFAAIDEEAS